MDEMEFTEAEANIQDLVAEYQQYQVRKYILFLLHMLHGIIYFRKNGFVH